MLKNDEKLSSIRFIEETISNGIEKVKKKKDLILKEKFCTFSPEMTNKFREKSLPKHQQLLKTQELLHI